MDNTQNNSKKKKEKYSWSIFLIFLFKCKNNQKGQVVWWCQNENKFVNIIKFITTFQLSNLYKLSIFGNVEIRWRMIVIKVVWSNGAIFHFDLGLAAPFNFGTHPCPAPAQSGKSVVIYHQQLSACFWIL